MLIRCLYTLLMLWPMLSALAGKPTDETKTIHSIRCAVSSAYGLSQDDPAVFETLKKRFNTQHMSLFTTAASVDSVAGAMQPDGHWADLAYTSKITSRWPGAVHWDRILLMTHAYRSPGHPAYNQPALKEKILTAMAWWNQTKPTSLNYWWNAIGVPLKMGETYLLLDADVPEAMKSDGLALMKLGVKPDFYDYHGVATGQNLVWLASIHLMIGVLAHDAQALKRAFGAIYDEIQITPKEGIQTDYSFHQHGPILYSGGYGLGFTQNLAQLIRLAQGTPYAFPSEKTALFSDFLLNGQQWMIRGHRFDHSAVGREISRPAGDQARLGNVIAGLDVPRKEAVQTFADRLTGKSVEPLVGNRHFWRSDFMTHHRTGYYSSVKMASNRISASESGNGENIKGYFLGHGVQLIYRTGNEYNGIFPVWDWRRLPGHLCEQSTETLPLFTWGKGAEGKTGFVGGASDGTYGVAAYDYQRGNVAAKRAWFHFDSEIVCLGAGVSCSTDNPLFQSLNQCHLNGDVLVSGAAKPLEKGTHSLAKTQWVWHDSVAYVFLDKPAVFVKNEAQTGAWKDINTAASAQPLRLDVFSLWLDFGKQVRNSTYAYIIRPGVSATSMKQYKSPIVVLKNDSTLQAVRHTGLNLTQAAFYRPGKLDAGNGLIVKASKPGLLLLQTTAKGIMLTLSNPQNQPLTQVITLNRKLTCSSCQWSASRRETTVTAELPTGEQAGKSLTLTLTNP